MYSSKEMYTIILITYLIYSASDIIAEQIIKKINKKENKE